MKKITLLFLIAATHFTAHGQPDENIIVGKKATIFSEILKENRRIWIYNPDQTSSKIIANKRYPVVYVLDGDAHFLSTVGVIQQLSQANGNAVLPEMIVVGIENTNRSRDLTPSSDTSAGDTKVNPFVGFLQKELIPYVDKNYHTAPYRVLIGHSLGGLTAIDILANSPKSFNAYLAIDPSMWYDGEMLLTRDVAEMMRSKFQGTRLFIGAANTMPAGMSLSSLGKDRSDETRHIRAIFKLDGLLKGHPTTGLTYSFRYYEHESHVSVPLVTEYDGLRFIFNYYLMNVTEKDLLDSTASIAHKYRLHYKKISTALGYEVAAPEEFINYLGYEAMSKKQYKRAEALFQLNMENYPGSHNAYDSYADYFSVINDSMNAIMYYRKALAVQPNDATQNKLDALTHSAKYGVSNVELVKYAGVYMLEKINIAVVLEVRGGVLWAKVQGQADDELTPVSKNVFTVKNKQGYTITFQMNDSRAVAFTSVQPNGVFNAVFEK